MNGRVRLPTPDFLQPRWRLRLGKRGADDILFLFFSHFQGAIIGLLDHSLRHSTVDGVKTEDVAGLDVIHPRRVDCTASPYASPVRD